MEYINRWWYFPIKGDKFKPNYVDLTLGRTYAVQFAHRTKLVKFIKVTPKGFNFLDESTSKCIMKRHMYAREYVGKVIPKDQKYFRVSIPPWIARITVLKESQTA